VFLRQPLDQSSENAWPLFTMWDTQRLGVVIVLYLSLLFLHFIGLALGVGTSFAMLTLGASTKDLAPDERAKFMLRAGALRKNGSIGLGLLILTGLAMFLLRGPAAVMAWGGPAFHLKLTLVVILIGFFGYMQVLMKKIRLAGGGPLMAKVPKLALIMLVLSVAIVLSAVVAFK
jgi:uncharacterized membrane protein